MSRFFRVLYWVVSVGVVLFLIGLGITIAKALIGVALVVGVGAVLYALFGKPRSTSLPPKGGS